jgi:SprT protein
MLQSSLWDACTKCFSKAHTLYGVDLQGSTRITLDLVGAFAGVASRLPTGSRLPSAYTLRFNKTFLQIRPEFILGQVVPHEIAHLVAWENPDLGASAHNKAWQSICLSLGGDGKARHDEPVYYARGATYAYNLPDGSSLHLSETRHRQVQRGRAFFTRSGQLIRASTPYRVVGYNGAPL